MIAKSITHIPGYVISFRDVKNLTPSKVRGLWMQSFVIFSLKNVPRPSAWSGTMANSSFRVCRLFVNVPHGCGSLQSKFGLNISFPSKVIQITWIFYQGEIRPWEAHFVHIWWIGASERVCEKSKGQIYELTLSDIESPLSREHHIKIWVHFHHVIKSYKHLKLKIFRLSEISSKFNVHWCDYFRGKYQENG